MSEQFHLRQRRILLHSIYIFFKFSTLKTVIHIWKIIISLTHNKFSNMLVKKINKLKMEGKFVTLNSNVKITVKWVHSSKKLEAQ